MLNALRRMLAGLLQAIGTGSKWLADKVRPAGGGGSGPPPRPQ